MINTDLIHLKLNKNYKIAYTILYEILENRCPDFYLLEALYGNQKAVTISDMLKSYFAGRKTVNLRPRLNNFDGPRDIILARRKLEQDSNYQRVHEALLLNKYPDIEGLRVFYGDYTHYVMEIFSMYIELNLKRKCEISAATHLNRVGSMAYQMKMNDYGDYKYSAIAVMHDTIEDLLHLTNSSETGTIDGELYDNFVNLYIPSELQEPVKILTNHFNSILNYILENLENEDKAFILRNVLTELEKIINSGLPEFSGYAGKMYDLFSKITIEEVGFDNLKWECYKSLYLNGIADDVIKNNDYRLFEIKGIDLSDNAHGKGSLSIDARIRNINKNMLWVSIGGKLGSTWKPFNDHLAEIKEDALQSAQYIILNDLLQPHSSLDFMMSALLKIEKLKDVFYE
ncbi:MAG: hypothetical protein MUE56_02420 [Ignavibacteria bacterium]|jgi:hypothetical protein|nr:hypothetical protein [Ignavibacteria bacterium]